MHVFHNAELCQNATDLMGLVATDRGHFALSADYKHPWVGHLLRNGVAPKFKIAKFGIFRITFLPAVESNIAGRAGNFNML